MKEYKSNEELINYLLSKGIIVSDKKDAIEKIEKYTYYSIVNTYKNVFKEKMENIFYYNGFIDRWVEDGEKRLFYMHLLGEMMNSLNQVSIN